MLQRAMVELELARHAMLRDNQNNGCKGDHCNEQGKYFQIQVFFMIPLQVKASSS